MRFVMLALLVACGSKSAAPSAPASSPPSTPPSNGQPAVATAECAVTGCSGSICAKAGADIVTTCEMKAEYACYAKAECKVQPDGQCGWTMDAPLKACLASPPPIK